MPEKNMRRNGIGIITTALCAALCVSVARAALPNFAPLGSDQMRAHYIHVGQGAAVLLEFRCGTALIDTGGEKQKDAIDSTALLIAYLNAYFARRADLNKTIDLLVLTHAHIDHTRATMSVFNDFTVKNLVDNGKIEGQGGLQQKLAHAKVDASNGQQKREAIEERKIGEPNGRTSAVIDPINCTNGTDPRFHALWGKLDRRRGFTRTQAGNPNNSSVVMRLDFGSASFLFPGDLEEDVHEDLLAFYSAGCTSACPLDVDVFHVAHHAADNGTSVALLRAMEPQIAVISMGDPTLTGPRSAKSHGHPRIDSVLRLMDVDHGGVTLERPERRVKVANFSGHAKPKPGMPPLGNQFEEKSIKRAIYGTAWDGTVVVTARANGTFDVDIEK
jgi:competence protein ComEC